MIYYRSSAPVGATAPTAPTAIGNRLARLRENFNATSVRKASKADATFRKHESNHERFILYLFDKKPQFLHQDFVEHLTDVDVSIEYMEIYNTHRRYQRNGGKKSLEKRKEDYRASVLRDTVAEALGPPGTTPPTQTVKFAELENDLDVFLEYLTSLRKKTGALFKPGGYASLRSSFTYLFHRYRVVPGPAFTNELKEAMEGVKRYTNEAVQHGEGNIHDGDRPLTWGLFEQFNRWFYAEGTDEGHFAACFAKVTCNLACRGNSTSQICTKHIKWLDDCLEIPFAHGKDQQTGDNQLKKLPRHCYANPLNLASDLPSALFHYFCTRPTIIAKPEEALFKGEVKSQAKRFMDIVRKICRKYEHIIKNDFGFDIADIGVHSWRKCAHSKLNTGSTAGPSGAAACIRGGHSMGKNRDVYIVHEKASDTYCGRILQGLPEHSPEFAVSYPDFVPLDLKQSMDSGISETELAERQVVVDREVNFALDSIFGVENLRAFPSIRRLLRIGLASHLIHYEAYDNPVYASDPRPVVPANSKLRASPLFTNPRILALKQHVAIAMPWESHYKYFSPATGIPPHVMIYAYIKSLDVKVENMPQKIEEILDRRQMAGPLSLDQIATAVENGPRITAIANDIAALRRVIQENGVVRGNTDTQASTSVNPLTQQPLARLQRQYQHPDGKVRRVPPSWEFPKLSMLAMYQYWHYGDATKKIPPMKYLHSSDVDYLGKGGRVRLTEVRKIMTAIDNEATLKGRRPQEHMDHQQAATCYYHGESIILASIPNTTAKGRVRKVEDMRWGTVVKYMHKKRNTSQQ